MIIVISTIIGLGLTFIQVVISYKTYQKLPKKQKDRNNQKSEQEVSNGNKREVEGSNSTKN